MGWIGNWGPLRHAFHGPQLLCMLYTYRLYRQCSAQNFVSGGNFSLLPAIMRGKSNLSHIFSLNGGKFGWSGGISVLSGG